MLGFMPALDLRLSMARKAGRPAKVVPKPATTPTISERRRFGSSRLLVSCGRYFSQPVSAIRPRRRTAGIARLNRPMATFPTADAHRRSSCGKEWLATVLFDRVRLSSERRGKLADAPGTKRMRGTACCNAIERIVSALVLRLLRVRVGGPASDDGLDVFGRDGFGFRGLGGLFLLESA